MIRILLPIAIFAVGYYIFKMIMSSHGATICTNCEGHGYWKGTRGEKNKCKKCEGTGKKM